MQYVLRRRELGTRQCTSNVRRSEQRGSKCALQSHAQETPPAAQPTLPGRGAQGGRSALGSEAHELSAQAKRLRTPSPANFACEDAYALWSWSQQLRVSCTLTPLSPCTLFLRQHQKYLRRSLCLGCWCRKVTTQVQFNAIASDPQTVPC